MEAVSVSATASRTLYGDGSGDEGVDEIQDICIAFESMINRLQRCAEGGPCRESVEGYDGMGDGPGCFYAAPEWQSKLKAAVVMARDIRNTFAYKYYCTDKLCDTDRFCSMLDHRAIKEGRLTIRSSERADHNGILRKVKIHCYHTPRTISQSARNRHA